MNKRGVIITAVLVGISALILAIAGANYYMNGNSTLSGETNTSSVLINTLYPTSSGLYIFVHSDISWNGTVNGSDFSERNIEGTGDHRERIQCNQGDNYSAKIQPHEAEKKLVVSAAWVTAPDRDKMTQEQKDSFQALSDAQRTALVNTSVLKSSGTIGDDGFVSISGSC